MSEHPSWAKEHKRRLGTPKSEWVVVPKDKSSRDAHKDRKSSK